MSALLGRQTLRRALTETVLLVPLRGVGVYEVGSIDPLVDITEMSGTEENIAVSNCDIC